VLLAETEKADWGTGQLLALDIGLSADRLKPDNLSLRIHKGVALACQ